MDGLSRPSSSGVRGSSLKDPIIMDISKKFVVFENENNNCWLDSSLSLIAFNKTFKKIVNKFCKSQINYITAKHEEAVAILNDPDNNIEDKINITRSILYKIQQSTLQYLQKFSNFKEGEPDSAFCALLNLILQDKSNIKEQLCASWSWIKQCVNCGNSSKYDPPMKPIITLPKVKTFQPENPVSFYTCSCKTEQKMKLFYKLLPSCLIFHFENGAGDGEKYPLSFTVERRNYHLTAIVVYEKSSDPNVNHFVTYIREPSLNLWLDCNDLNPTIATFSPEQPKFTLKDVCIYVYEAFDNLGKISFEVSTEISTETDKNKEDFHVECIDLVNEVEEVKQPVENVDDKHNSSNILCASVRNKESLLNLDRKLAKERQSSINNTVKRQVEVKQPAGNVDNKGNSSNLCPSVKNKEHSLNLEGKLAKERQLSINNIVRPVMIKDTDRPVINYNMLHNSKNVAVKENISCSGKNEKEDQSDLHSLTGVSVNKINSQSFKRSVSPMNSSPKADCHTGASTSKSVKSKRTDEPREVSLSPDSVRRRRKFTNETSRDTDKSVDAKVRKIVDDVVPRTVAAFMEQLLWRNNTPE